MFEHWIPIKDGDDRARALYLKYYSARHYKDGRRRWLFIGPGEKHVFMTVDCLALWAWRKFIDDAEPKQTGVNNAIFIRHPNILSSELIKEATAIGWQIYPSERLYTYVDPSEVKSTNPGYCYLMAGWKRCPYLTKTGKVVLEINPTE